MSKDIEDIERSNSNMTYGQSVGYMIGIAAKSLGDRYAGLSPDEWQNATDDYAHGYRMAWRNF